MRHLVRRVGFYLVAFWVAITLNFLIPHLAPGDPASILMARFQGRIDPVAMKSLEAMFGISHDPLWVQYLQYLNNLLHGNMGLSINHIPTPVSDVIAQDLPWTLVLAGTAVVISFALGSLLGIIVAWRRGTLVDNVLPPFLTFLGAIPYFWLALILLYLLGFILHWFPVSGGYDLSYMPGWDMSFIASAVQHAILPALTFILVSIAGWMLGMRNMMITTLAEDYVLMAEAKGLSQRRVMLAYAARNAILPNITAFGMALGFVVAGQLVIEIVFSYPGIGFELLQAVQGSDYALAQGIFLYIVIAVLGANFLLDLVYTTLDPRVRQERS
ncbi:MAG TPA: ABC transporter permease [Ktedonobacteraceae bacterium]|nr:ABC transporter permease [Ktedonobacteraceae bacterium]